MQCMLTAGQQLVQGAAAPQKSNTGGRGKRGGRWAAGPVRKGTNHREMSGWRGQGGSR